MNNADVLSRTLNAGNHQQRAESPISSIIPTVSQTLVWSPSPPSSYSHCLCFMTSTPSLKGNDKYIYSFNCRLFVLLYTGTLKYIIKDF